MKDLQDWAAVQKVYKQTQSKRQIAEILGISRNTVKKLLKLREPPKYHRMIYHSKIDPYKDKIIKWRTQDFNGTRILKELRDIGYEGSSGPTGIGRNACHAGYKVLFVNAKELVDWLYTEMLNGALADILKQLDKIDLLIIDELSYIKMDKEKESLFFRSFANDMKKAPLVV